MVTVSLLAFLACVPLVCTATGLPELRYVHSHDAGYDTGSVHPDWAVSGDGTSGRIESATNCASAGGYVLCGRKLRVPRDMADCRASVEFRMSFVEPDWRSLKGHLGVAVMDEATWDAMGRQPDGARVLDFYKNANWIHHVKLDGYNSSTSGFIRVESPNLSPKLEDYKGEQLVFALIWGTTRAGSDWCEYRNLNIQFRNPKAVETDFLKAFRTDIPGLEAMHRAVRRGSISRAKKILTDYYRARSEPVYLHDPKYAMDENRSYAQEACEGKFFAPKTSVPPVAIDRAEMWSAMPENQEQWAISLNRHYLWAWLGAAFKETGDRRFLEEFETELFGWDASMPVRFGRFFTEGLHDEFGQLPLTLNAGLRMGHTWFSAMENMKAGLSPEALYTLLFWMHEHGRYLEQPAHCSPQSNWGSMQVNGLFNVGVMLPEFRDAKRWRALAEERMVYMLGQQVYPDGVQKELTPAYHRITTVQFVSSLRLARRNGIVLSDTPERIVKDMYIALAGIMMPDFRTPDVNDSSRVAAADLGVAAELFPDEKMFAWFASNRAEGQAPDFCSVSFPWAGWRMMRESWASDAACLYFDSGPLGVSHFHEDKLSFMLHAEGELLVRDFGFYPYDNSKWSLHSRSPWAHNTVLVDGCGQNRTASHPEFLTVDSPEENGTWISNENFDYAKGIYSNALFTNVAGEERHLYHQREILYVKPDVFVVVDTLVPSDEKEHQYDTLFHLNSAAAEIDGASGTVSSRVGDARLRIVPLSGGMDVRIAAGESEPALMGWERTSTIGKLNPMAVAVYRSLGTGKIRNVWLLLPEDAQGSPVPVEVESGGEEGSFAEISFKLPGGKIHRIALGESGIESMDFRPVFQ